ncbi:hypothetical protein FH966_02375 [Lentibacillus cibarius]|uniref:Lipoprotein n=1 Tax=Lentibacillus cibarius TaxID=2583219 RepID=A0A549YFI9_9BACI|nr:hypothetical protein [Lentibacillus cibarius]TRM10659.1 hypothetical protein FH966_02375 [Lentibacillus cibarius]
MTRFKFVFVAILTTFSLIACSQNNEETENNEVTEKLDQVEEDLQGELDRDLSAELLEEEHVKSGYVEDNDSIIKMEIEMEKDTESETKDQLKQKYHEKLKEKYPGKNLRITVR